MLLGLPSTIRHVLNKWSSHFGTEESASLSEQSRELAKEGGLDAMVDTDIEDLFER